MAVTIRLHRGWWMLLAFTLFSALALLASLRSVSPGSAGLADPPGVQVFVGYADNLRANPVNFPSPWNGSANVIFQGCVCTYDNGAVMLFNNTASAITVNSIEVDISSDSETSGSATVSAGDSLVVQFGDTSDVVGQLANCTPDGFIPQVKVTINGTPAMFSDTAQVLNTGGFDLADCPGGPNTTPVPNAANESTQWQLIGAPPPACTGALLNFAPPSQTGTVGAVATVQATLTNGCGTPLINVLVGFTVLSGPNTGLTGSATTNSSGVASFSYSSSAAGSDTLQASVTNLAGTFSSNTVTVTWAPTPTAANVDVSNADGPQGETTAAASFTDPSNLVIGASSLFDKANVPSLHPGEAQTVIAYRTINGGLSWSGDEIAPGDDALKCAKSFAGDPFVAAARPLVKNGVSQPGAYYYSFASECVDTGASDVSVAHSTDGAAWSSVVVVHGINHKAFQDKPMLTVDNTPTSPTAGRIYLTWVARIQGSSLPFLALVWSDDNGATWSNRKLIKVTLFGVPVQIPLVVRVDITGTDTTPPTPQVCPGGGDGCFDFSPYVAVDRNGQVSAIWYNYVTDRVEFATSMLHPGPPGVGLVPAFNSPTLLDTPGFGSIHLSIPAQPDWGINPDPSLLIDDSPTSAHRGRMYAMWTKFAGVGPPATVTNIVLSTSADGSQTWTGPVKVNDDNADPAQQWGSTNFFGQEALDRTTGALHVSFYSTRLDTRCKSMTFCPYVGCIGSGPCPGPQPPPVGVCPINCTTDIFYARSTDGSASCTVPVCFTPSQRVTEASSDESVGNSNRCSQVNELTVGEQPFPQISLNNCFQYGDYEAIAVDQSGVAHPVWTDARLNLFSSGLDPVDEEVYTATIPPS